MRRRAGVAKGPLPAGREAESFERISWDEALDEIAARLAAIASSTARNPSCPTPTPAPSACSATAPWIAASSTASAPRSSTAPSAPAPAATAFITVYGRKLGTETEQFHARGRIIAWGANIHGNNVHLWPLIEEARRPGARLIVIDPYQTRTAKLADWHIAIHPGTDAALALGMMHVIFARRS